MFRLRPQSLVSRFRQTQKLNEKMLRSELEAIDEVVRDSSVSSKSPGEAEPLIRQRSVEKVRRMLGISRKGTVNPDKVRKYSGNIVNDENASFDSGLETPRGGESTRSNPLEQFESMKRNPKYQDLTHGEARRGSGWVERSSGSKTTSDLILSGRSPAR